MRYVLLATLLLLASCGPQPTPKTSAEIAAFDALTERTVGLMRKISSGAPAVEVQTANRELLAAFAAAQPQINAAVSRIGASSGTTAPGQINPMMLQACLTRTNGAPIDVNRRLDGRVVNVSESDFRADWVNVAINCAAAADAYLGTLSDRRAADDVGFAISALHSLTLAVFADLGLDAPLSASVYRAQLDDYRLANEAIIRKLAPKCLEWTIEKPLQVSEVHYECIAYDGRTAHGFEVYEQHRLASAPLDRARISAQATRFTSRGLATAAQPQLDALIRALDERDHEG